MLSAAAAVASLQCGQGRHHPRQDAAGHGGVAHQPTHAGEAYTWWHHPQRPLPLCACCSVGCAPAVPAAGSLDAHRLCARRARACVLDGVQVCDVRAIAAAAHAAGALVVVDNSFLTPLYQRPLDLGADVSMTSGTKYVGGHGDTTLGLLAVRDAELAKRLYFHQNAEGAGLAPMDCWLALRGLKTVRRVCCCAAAGRLLACMHVRGACVLAALRASAPALPPLHDCLSQTRAADGAAHGAQRGQRGGHGCLPVVAPAGDEAQLCWAAQPPGRRRARVAGQQRRRGAQL